MPICACITIGYIFPILNVAIHQWKWEQSKPASYSIVRTAVGMCDETTYIEDLIPPISEDTIDPIDNRFREAYECEFSFPSALICHVEFDEVYGYPSSIGGMFLEGCWTKVTEFRVHD